MDGSNKSGFTIIETMLFLGISGLLVVGVLVGTGLSISTQRYRDSVQSLQANLQQQYFEVASVISENDDTTCNGSVYERGQSNCIVLGKFVTTNNGTEIVVKRIIGTVPDSAISDDDIQSIRDHGVSTINEGSSTIRVDWGASLFSDTTDPSSELKLTMLVIKSPASGAIYTFISNSIVPEGDIGDMLVGDPPVTLKQDSVLCVNPRGMFFGTPMSVKINAGASSTNDITVLGEDSGC